MSCRDSGYATHQPASPDLEMQLRLQYSMTIIRLVNGISDSSQKGRVAASVLSNAEEAGKQCPTISSPLCRPVLPCSATENLPMSTIGKMEKSRCATDEQTRTAIKLTHCTYKSLVATLLSAWQVRMGNSRCCAGLPRMLVAVRHEAAHNELPSLSHLRLGVDRALAWLKENYWERQAQYLQTNQALVSSLLKVLHCLLSPHEFLDIESLSRSVLSSTGQKFKCLQARSAYQTRPPHAIMCLDSTQQLGTTACGRQHREPAEYHPAVQEYVAIRQALLAKSFPASAAVAADAAVEEDGEDGEEAAATHADHEQSAGECASAGKIWHHTS